MKIKNVRNSNHRYHHFLAVSALREGHMIFFKELGLKRKNLCLHVIFYVLYFSNTRVAYNGCVKSTDYANGYNGGPHWKSCHCSGEETKTKQD